VKAHLIFGLFILTTVAAAAADGVCLRHAVSPGYPRLARIAQIQGEVRVTAIIGQDGKVASASSSGGHKLLRDASETNIRQWKFCSSGSEHGTEPRELVLKYVYRLEGEQEYYDPPAFVVFDLPDRINITSRPYKPQP